MEITKKILAKQYAEKHSTTIKNGAEGIDRVLDLIVENLVDGNDVTIKDFFYFRVKELKEKKAISLVDGKPTTIPATKTVVAKMTKNVKQKVQGKR